jgi:hypothetical protein
MTNYPFKPEDHLTKYHNIYFNVKPLLFTIVDNYVL